MIGAAREALEPLGVNPELREHVLRWLRLTDSVDLDAALFGRLIRISPAEAERIADALAQSGIFDEPPM